MDRLSQFEKTAVDLVRGAGRYGAYLSHLGFEVAGVADWLESQIPRLRPRLRGAVLAMARAAGEELTRSSRLPSDRQER
jgi:hypothetical protein